MLAHAYNIIIYRGVRALGHRREVVDVLNSIDTNLLSMLMKNVQLLGIAAYDSQMSNSYLNCEHRHKFSKGISKIYFRPNMVTWIVGSQ